MKRRMWPGFIVRGEEGKQSGREKEDTRGEE
jgi:hypothetical protein